MYTGSLNRFVAEGGGWLKSFATKWLGGAKPSIVIAKPATAPICSPIGQAQTSLIARWNFAERLNQYAERNRLIEVYTRQYRRYVIPFPRPGVRGFGTLFGFLAFAPTLRNVDSKEASDNWQGYDGSSMRDWTADSLFSKSHFVDCDSSVKPLFGTDVRKLDDLNILRRANPNDGAASMLPGAFDVFLAKRNLVADANSCRIIEIENEEAGNDYERASIEEISEEINISESKSIVNELQTNALLSSFDGNTSTPDDFLVVQHSCDDNNSCAPIDKSSRIEPIALSVDRNTKSLREELDEAEDSSTCVSDYSVISDDDAANEEQFHFVVSTKASSNMQATHQLLCNSNVSHIEDVAYDRSFVEVESIGDTVFEVSKRDTRCCYELENKSKTRVKMREVPVSDSPSQSAIERTRQCLDVSPSQETFARSATDQLEYASRSFVASCEDATLLRRLYDIADYFVYAFSDHRDMPAHLTNMVVYAPSFQLVAPKLSILHAPVCNVLGSQLITVAEHSTNNLLGAWTLRANRRARQANAAGVIRSLCMFSTLRRLADESQFRKENRTEAYWAVRQKPLCIRHFLRELELEILDSRALSHCMVQSCAQAFDSTLSQLLEFGWSALMKDRLRFESFDFERLIDALGVELDATGSPHVVPLGDLDSFESLFVTPSVRSTSSRDSRLGWKNEYESFASFTFVVYLNVRRVVDAIELSTVSNDASISSSISKLRCGLIDAMCAAREENVDELRVMINRLRESAKF